MNKTLAVASFITGIILFFVIPSLGMSLRTDSGHIRLDTSKHDYVKNVNRFFANSAKQSMIDMETDKATIEQNRILQDVQALTRQARSFLKKEFDTLAFKHSLQQIIHWHEVAKDGVFEHQGSAHTARNLTTTYHIFEALRNQGIVYKKRVDAYMDQLVKYRFEIDSLSNDKSLFILSSDSLEIAQYVHKLKVLAIEIAPVTQQLKNSINSTQSLQNAINLELLKLETGMEEILYLQDQVGDRTFKKEFAPLWQESAYNRPFSEIVAISYTKATLVLSYYIKGHVGKLFVVLLALGLVVGYIYSLRSALQNNHLEFRDAMLLNRPLVAGLAISISVAQFLFPNPPFIFTAAVLITLGILVTILLRGFIKPYWMSVWVTIFLLFVAAAVDNLILQASRPERWFILWVSSTASAVGLFVLFHKRKHVELQERWILVPIGLMTLLVIASTFLNILGLYNTAKVLLVSGLLNVVVAIIFLWVLRLVNEGLSFASELYKKQESRLFYINYNRVGQRAPSFFYAILIVGWFVLFGRNFYEFKLLSEPLREFFQSEHQLGSFTFSINNILIFMLIMVSATVLSKIVSYFATDTQWNGHSEKQERKFRLGSWLLLVRISIIVIGFFLAFAAVGIPIQQITLIIGALGVGIGFGLQTLVNNLVSGLIIAFEKPVNVDDLVDIGGQSGKVKSIGFRSSVIATFDGADLIMPNGDLLNSHVINWTTGGFKKRLSVHIEVAYGADLNVVNQLILAAVEADSQILNNPTPSVQYGEVSAQSVVVILYFWTKTNKDGGVVRSDIIRAITSSLAANNIALALPKQEVIWKKEE
ncbi:mechanosensitive ion channel [Sphingobacterium psychroaquaticum]|uniref:mechanosensitive ion channel family protein n=1 Tax=Sphingobacterium psychroaquaticum TaxID=561061 RepID=UPI00106BCEE6|nr:mechanosensitive ion channel domain-containing protein [Sphingobacterium psychroaquaticum]QBQ41336.1 mechanosensitive ion channel [Sphingobacterium psychroaquaticum]